MKKLIPLSLAVVMLLTAVMAVSTGSANAQSAGLVSSILNKMERNRRDLRSLRASISMEKFNSQLGDRDKYEGVMAYMPAAGRKAYVRVEWQRPRREILTVADGAYQLYNQRQNVVYEGNEKSTRAKAGSALSFLNMTGAQLKASFNTEYLGEENLWGDVNTSHLKIVPRGAASYKYAEIWVDSSGMLIQAKVVERSDDSTTVRLLNLQRNAGVSADEFRQQLPDSVKRVKG